MSRLLNIAASLRLTVVSLLALGVLVFWGTLYQVDYGIFTAQQRYFDSWFLLLGGWFPFPGGQAVLTVLFVNLLAATFVRMHLGWRQAGLLIIHMGLLMLLFGGFMIRQLAEESFLSLDEGASSNLSTSWHEWELSFWKKDSGGVRDVTGLTVTGLDAGSRVSLEVPRVDIAIRQNHAHAAAMVHSERPEDGIVRIEPRATQKETLDNMPGLELELTGTDGGPVNLLLFGGQEKVYEITVAGEPWELELRRKRHVLPMTIELIDFQREMHPGSEIASSYSSHVQIDTAAGPRRVHIKMNEPLRYKGFTVFQNAFQEGPDGRQLSTFAVVKNAGRLLPYVASILTFLGLAVHFVVEVTLRRKAAS